MAIAFDTPELFLRGDDAKSGRDSGVKPLRLPANSPNLNAYAERFVLSIRRECFDRFVPLNERHLRTAITEYVVHYHTERNHQGLGNELITPLPASANDAGPIASCAKTRPF